MELLACIGLTFILKYGTILNAPRDLFSRLKFFEDLFKCSLCLGFWSGVVVFCMTGDNILIPLASAAVCWCADSVVGILQYIEIKLEKQLD